MIKARFKQIAYALGLLKENFLNWLKRPVYARDEAYTDADNASFVMDAGTYAYITDSDEKEVIITTQLRLNTSKDRGANVNEYFYAAIIYNIRTKLFYIKEGAYSSTPIPPTFTNDEIVVMEPFKIELLSEPIVQPPAPSSGIVHTNVANEFASVLTKTVLTGNEKILAEDPADSNKKIQIPASSISPDLSGYVQKALFDANTMLLATSDNTPVAKGSGDIRTFLSLVTANWCKVGTGGDFASFQLAYDAGFRYMIQVSNITLAADQTLGAGVYIFSNRIYTITCGNYTFGEYLEGCYFFQCIFLTAITTVSKYFILESNSANPSCIMQYCTITDTSAVNHNLFRKVRCYECTVNLPNSQVSLNSSYFYGGTFNGGGSSCSIFDSFGFYLSGHIIMSGTFATGYASYAYFIYLPDFAGYGSGTFYFHTSSNNFYPVSDISLPNVTVIYLDISSNRNFSNCTFKTLEQGASITTYKLYFTNCFFVGTTALTTTGLKAVFVNCVFAMALTIPSGADVEFYNCKTVGITISSGAICNIVAGRHTTIVVNANNINVQNVLKSTSITLNPAVTGCDVSHNQCDTAIVAVAGNICTPNTEY